MEALFLKLFSVLWATLLAPGLLIILKWWLDHKSK